MTSDFFIFNFGIIVFLRIAIIRRAFRQTNAILFAIYPFSIFGTLRNELAKFFFILFAFIQIYFDAIDASGNYLACLLGVNFMESLKFYPKVFAAIKTDTIGPQL